MIDQETALEVLSGCREVLGLEVVGEQTMDDPLLAGLLRRAAGIHCPCSRATLRAAILECLQHLTPADEITSDRVDAAIESLIVGGDLLELNDFVTDGADAAGSWVFAAPPSFVVRPSGGIFLFGIVPDQDTFLPNYIAKQVVHIGHIRMIPQHFDANIVGDLRELSLQEVTEGAWLKRPRPETAEKMVGRFERLLSHQPPAGSINNLTILDPSRSVSYYRGRWTDPKEQTGTFIARRPQEFGAPIWCFVCLKNGVPVQLLDLPPPNLRRWRSCDIAWHLQMAIDHLRSAPQQYRRICSNDGVRFDFFSPIPQWSQRRLMIFGHEVPQEKCLFSYLLPPSEAATEDNHLQQSLWLRPTEESAKGTQ